MNQDYMIMQYHFAMGSQLGTSIVHTCVWDLCQVSNNTYTLRLGPTFEMFKIKKCFSEIYSPCKITSWQATYSSDSGKYVCRKTDVHHPQDSLIQIPMIIPFWNTISDLKSLKRYPPREPLDESGPNQLPITFLLITF